MSLSPEAGRDGRCVVGQIPHPAQMAQSVSNTKRCVTLDQWFPQGSGSWSDAETHARGGCPDSKDRAPGDPSRPSFGLGSLMC
jgi:hypothetical protein